MKKCFKFSLVAFLLALLMALTSCQDEEPFEETIDVEKTLSFDSAALELMKETVSNDGSYDNIVDGASCFDIQFPYEVVVNEEKLTVDSMGSLQILEETLDAFEDYESSMDVVFPVTITMADYTEVAISTKEELEKVASQCVEGGSDADIECIDLVYPATVFTYNPNFQQTASVVVEHDAELRRFFAGLEDTDLVSFDFPITLKYIDSTEVTASTNTELADILNQAKEACDEDDDNDYNDDDFTQEQLDSVLVECPWNLIQVQRKSENESEQYINYAFSFEEGGKVISYGKSGYKTEGEWSTSVVDYRVVLTLNFKSAEQFNNTWKVYEIKEGKIKMFVQDDFLTLEKNCGYEPEVCEAKSIQDRLSLCSWRMSDEKGEFFEDLSIDFGEQRMLVYDSNGEVLDEGSWMVEGNLLAFSGLSKSLANYIGNWQVLECGEEYMKIQRKVEVVVLTKLCS
ncbi:hypothetical protein D9O36_07645 [Zobellia amurskyensis]|uniref:Lipoprotein n=1 Tax=Zobellia amurskyensis TaxID=248905 RepID=A0A7X2ZSR4_9FLAO|nr:hypothetical protein [Zobellia amurskyensis]MUH35708.1 hypothetical protein [Zobellia amurskyensis]